MFCGLLDHLLQEWAHKTTTIVAEAEAQVSLAARDAAGVESYYYYISNTLIL